MITAQEINALTQLLQRLTDYMSLAEQLWCVEILHKLSQLKGDQNEPE